MTIHPLRASVLDISTARRAAPPSVRPAPPPPEQEAPPAPALPARAVEAEPVAKKKTTTRSPEAVAKQKATLARKRAEAEQAKLTRQLKRHLKPTKPATNQTPIAITGIREFLRTELEAMKPELRLIVRDELRKLLGGT